MFISAHVKHGQSMLSEDTLLALRKFCRTVSYEPSKLNLYGLAAGGGGTLDLVTKHMYTIMEYYTPARTTVLLIVFIALR
eukprot:COSAG02_NODE_7021_length_3223_cov_3.718630_3_plen_80_part_00